MIAASTTISDVAAAAGVSIATVSRALRNLPGVSEHTRNRVLGAAQRLEYVMAPLPIGRTSSALARVGVVAPRLSTWFFGSVVAALVSRLDDLGFLSELHVISDQKARNRFFSCAPLRRRVDGVIIIGMSLTGYEISSVSSLGVPVVGLHTNLPAPNVTLDDAAMARCAVDHLIGLGHTRIAMIASESGAAPLHVVPKSRSAGYHQAMQEAGIPVEEDLIRCGDDTATGGARAMSRLLARRALPTAVFAHTDEMAFGVFGAVRGAGLRVPADISVVAIDNCRLASAFQLTTVAQRVDDQGREAADLVARLVRQLDTVTAPAPGHRQPQLVIRASTAPCLSGPLRVSTGQAG